MGIVFIIVAGFLISFIVSSRSSRKRPLKRGKVSRSSRDTSAQQLIWMNAGASDSSTLDDCDDHKHHHHHHYDDSSHSSFDSGSGGFDSGGGGGGGD